MNFNNCSSMSYGGQFAIYLTSIGFIVTTAVSQIQSIADIFTKMSKAKKDKKAPQKTTKTANHSTAK